MFNSLSYNVAYEIRKREWNGSNEWSKHSQGQKCVQPVAFVRDGPREEKRQQKLITSSLSARVGVAATGALAQLLADARDSGRVPKVLVLAGRRNAGLDPLAEQFGVTHKCLVPVRGEAMISRVLKIVDEAFPTAPLFVSIEDFSIIRGEDIVERLVGEGRLTPIDAREHIVDSIVTASETTLPSVKLTLSMYPVTRGRTSTDSTASRRPVNSSTIMTLFSWTTYSTSFS